MSDEDTSFIRLSRDYYLDDDDIGSLISVIVEYDRYNMLSRYDDCLLIDLYRPDGIRPKGMIVLHNGNVRNIKFKTLKNIKIKFIS
jgi:hypothetical protein